MLVNHADAVAAGLGGPRQDNSLAGDDDIAGIRGVKAGRDVHHRRFAGAVFAQEGMNFACARRKGRAIECDRTVE